MTLIIKVKFTLCSSLVIQENLEINFSFFNPTVCVDDGSAKNGNVSFEYDVNIDLGVGSKIKIILKTTTNFSTSENLVYVVK